MPSVPLTRDIREVVEVVCCFQAFASRHLQNLDNLALAVAIAPISEPMLLLSKSASTLISDQYTMSAYGKLFRKGRVCQLGSLVDDKSQVWLSIILPWLYVKAA